MTPQKEDRMGPFWIGSESSDPLAHIFGAVVPLNATPWAGRIGYRSDHVTGRHYILIDPNRQGTVVPIHGSRDLQRKTLLAIMKQVGVPEETFRRLFSRRLPP